MENWTPDCREMKGFGSFHNWTNDSGDGYDTENNDGYRNDSKDDYNSEA